MYLYIGKIVLPKNICGIIINAAIIHVSYMCIYIYSTNIEIVYVNNLNIKAAYILYGYHIGNKYI